MSFLSDLARLICGTPRRTEPTIGMYSLEQLHQMAEIGLIDWSVYHDAVAMHQQSREMRSFQVQQAMQADLQEQQFNEFAATQDRMFGSNVQEQAAKLRQACDEASRKSTICRVSASPPMV